MEDIIKKIEIDENHTKTVLEWLAKDKYNGLSEFQTHSVIRLILKKIIELEYKINNDGNIQRSADKKDVRSGTTRANDI